jgi:DNA helicase-2/ATP-dependent DNA helicase PcrA
MIASLSDELNQEQLSAVTAPDGPVFVLAAAGTGKTRTLVYRVAYLVNNGVQPQRILLLTFTNKAASEMLERARYIVGDNVGGLWGGTFHHMANRILRRYGTSIDIPSDYTIIDREDAVSLMRAVISELKIPKNNFPKPDVLLALYSSFINKNVDIEEAFKKHFSLNNINCEEVIRVIKLYKQKKKANNLLDFDDLLLSTLELFQKSSYVLSYYQEQFLHILVDEYQDTNYLQAEIVDLLAKKYRNVFVVGDDFQSIYSWRGADFKNIITFPKRYPDAKMYKLETNYRSSPEILTIANAAIAGNPNQFQKNLKAVRPSGCKPCLVKLTDGEHQALFIANQIKKLQTLGIANNEIAVLYRSHFLSMELQLALTKTNIPFSITSGIRFFEQVHIKDMMAFIRLFHNQSDELAFSRFLQLLPGVGEKKAQVIWLSLEKKCNLLQQETQKKILASLPKDSKSIWITICKLINNTISTQQEMTSYTKIMEEFLTIFYNTYLIENFEDSEKRLEDIYELIAFTAKFDSLSSLLHEITLLSNVDAEIDPLETDGGAVSRIHNLAGRRVLPIWKSNLC